MQISSAVSATANNDAYVLFYNNEKDLLNHVVKLDDQLETLVSALQSRHDLPEVGAHLLLPVFESSVTKFLMLCHVKPSAQSFKKIGASAATALAGKKLSNIILDAEIANFDLQAAYQTVIRGFSEENYHFDQLKSKKEDRAQEATLQLVCSKEAQATIDALIAQEQAIAKGTYLTKDLGNLPANICTPTYLAKQAEILSEQYASISTEVLEKEEMERLGMGALLSVAQGSTQAPKLVKMVYKPENAINQKPIIFVGKGVTFDAGGISIKPAANMDLMKYDMGGAASVFGVMQALAVANLNVYVIGIVPTVENLPDGNAVKPGDIVRSLSGQTIEVLNTDAEGRLILCDALTYAQQFEPEALIDIATLTGACVVALGSPRAGLLGNNQPLMDALYQAGEKSDDKVWQLPLDEAYVEMLKSPFADLANISSSREAGTITAAGFLSSFTKGISWAHLDIAGVAWNSAGPKKGGTGRPVALLFTYLQNRAAKA